MSTPENPPPTGGDEPGRGLSGVQRAGIVLGGLAVLLIVFVVLRGGDDSGSDSSSSSAAAPLRRALDDDRAEHGVDGHERDRDRRRLGVRDGLDVDLDLDEHAGRPREPDDQRRQRPAAGRREDRHVQEGRPGGLKVNSDTADEIHVHGYDLMKDVEKGGSVTFTFKATIDGRFEVELENAGTQIANLEVTPS